MINITEGIDKGNYMKFGLRIAVTMALISASAAASICARCSLSRSRSGRQLAPRHPQALWDWDRQDPPRSPALLNPRPSYPVQSHPVWEQTARTLK